MILNSTEHEMLSAKFHSIYVLVVHYMNIKNYCALAINN
jgi:hypothetical protein